MEFSSKLQDLNSSSRLLFIHLKSPISGYHLLQSTAMQVTSLQMAGKDEIHQIVWQLRNMKQQKEQAICQARQKSRSLTQHRKQQFEEYLCLPQNKDSKLNSILTDKFAFDSRQRGKINLSVVFGKISHGKCDKSYAHFEHYNHRYKIIPPLNSDASSSSRQQFYNQCKFVPKTGVEGQTRMQPNLDNLLFINSSKEVCTFTSVKTICHQSATEAEPVIDLVLPAITVDNVMSVQPDNQLLGELKTVPTIDFPKEQIADQTDPMALKTRNLFPKQNLKFQLHPQLKVRNKNRPISARSNISRKSTHSRRGSCLVPKKNHWVDELTVSDDDRERGLDRKRSSTINPARLETNISAIEDLADRPDWSRQFPSYICPSSEEKSQVYLCNLWVAKSNFRNSIKTVPLL